MVSPERIQQLADRIGSLFQPQKVIVFGSYAYGEPTEDSDVDIFVVLPFTGRNVAKAIEIEGAVDPDFAIDLLASTPERVAQRLDWGDCFLQDVTSRGKVLYESAHVGVGR